MTSQELREFWDPREFKVWVVSLIKYQRGKAHTVDRKIVRARTERGAIHTARVNSMVKGALSGVARYADPVTDLGCVPAGGISL